MRSNRSARSIRNQVSKQIEDNMGGLQAEIDERDQARRLEATQQYDEGTDIDQDLTVCDAFTNRILRDCKETALGTSLMTELKYFIESLELNYMIAEFPI